MLAKNILFIALANTIELREDIKKTIFFIAAAARVKTPVFYVSAADYDFLHTILNIF